MWTRSGDELASRLTILMLLWHDAWLLTVKCVCVYACVHACVHVCVCMRACLHVCKQLCVPLSVCASVCVLFLCQCVYIIYNVILEGRCMCAYCACIEDAHVHATGMFKQRFKLFPPWKMFRSEVTVRFFSFCFFLWFYQWVTQLVNATNNTRAPGDRKVHLPGKLVCIMPV